MRILAIPSPFRCMIQVSRRFLPPMVRWHPGVSPMRRNFRAVCCVVAVLGAFAQPCSPLAAEQPIDLSDYRTVATAQTASPAALVGASGERRPSYLGVNAEVDANNLRVAAVEPESPAAR